MSPYKPGSRIAQLVAINHQQRALAAASHERRLAPSRGDCAIVEPPHASDATTREAGESRRGVRVFDMS